MTRRTRGNPTANPSNKDPGNLQQANRNKAQRRPRTGKPSNIQLLPFFSPPHCPFFFKTFFLAVRSAAENHPASTPAPPGRKKTGGRPPIARVHAAPVSMDDESDVSESMPATAGQDCTPPAVTYTRRQAQAPNKSTSARQSVRTSYRTVPDDEEEEIEEDITDEEGEDEGVNIYGGFDGAVGDALGNEVGRHFRWHVFQVSVN